MLIFLGMSFSNFAQLQVNASRPDATYEAGEMMYFEVLSDTWGEVNYIIRFDPKTPPLKTGKIIVNPGVPVKIPFLLEEPGSVLCRVTQGSNSIVGGAIFSKYDLQGYVEEPADFDDFWDGVKTELANVPIDPVLTFLDSSNLSKTYRINLGNINNRRVYGYISIPKGISPPYPAMLTLPPFGSIGNICVPETNIAEWGGALSISINIHEAEPDEIDPNSYEPTDISNPDLYYYKHSIAGAMRAIDYIFTRSDFNGTDMGVVGISQGGGLALMTAGVDQRVKCLVQTVSALCGHSGHRWDRPAGLPLFIRDSRGSVGTISHEDSTLNASKYYDGIFFAKRYKGPTCNFISYADTISPLETIYTAINQFREKEITLHSLRLGHQSPSNFYELRSEFWRKVFPAMQNNPFPWTPTTTGYDVTSNADFSIPSGGSANLSADVTYNGTALNNLATKWMTVEGPGKVTFTTSPTSYSTSATFSEDGEYIFRFTAMDSPNLNTQFNFVTVSDFVKVTVGN
ncbi:MAG: acetylxylan esterase [Saprospiraceae bacterium]